MAFVIDVFARRFVVWRVSSTMQTDFVLDALGQALYERTRDADALVHHSDRDSQYLSIRYTERLAEVRIQPSVGSRGDSYDDALAESINGLHKAELIHRRCPWKTREAVELATLQWVQWFNHTRLLTPMRGTEAEANYWRQLAREAEQVASTKPTNLHDSRGDSSLRGGREWRGPVIRLNDAQLFTADELTSAACLSGIHSIFS